MTRSAWGAFVRRDWRIARSYRFPFIAGVVSTFFALGLFYFLSDIVNEDEIPAGSGGDQGYFSFVLVGMVLLEVLTVGLYAVAQRIREEQTTGTLETVMATPLPSWLVAVGTASYEVLYGTVAGAFSALVGVLVFGVSFDVSPGSAAALFVTAVATLAFVGALGIGLAALTIIFKQTAALAAMTGTAVAMLSGAYFPVETLPQPLEALSWLSPFRWSLDVARPALFGGEVPVGELCALVAVGAVALPVSFVGFRSAVAWAKRHGSLAEY